jgi:hypothetical protein
MECSAKAREVGVTELTYWMFGIGLVIGIVGTAYAIIKADSQSGPKF